MDRFIGGELMRKVAALLLIVLFINFLPLYPIAENPQPDITVNGNQVEVKFGEVSSVTFGGFTDAKILTEEIPEEYEDSKNILKVK